MPVAPGIALSLLRGVAVVVVGAAAAASLRHRGEPSARPFVVALAAITGWAALVAVAELPGVVDLVTVGGANLLGLAKALCGLTVPIAWLVYAVEYSGRGERLRGRRLALLVAPVVAAALVLTVRVALGENAPALVAGLVGVLFFLAAVYLIGLYLIGVYLLAGLSTTYQQVTYAQVAAVSAGVALPYLAAVASTLGRPDGSGGIVDYLPFDVTFLGFLLAGVVLLAAVRRYPLFTVFPGAEYVARDEVVEGLGDAVVVLDREEQILDLNPAAARLCERPATDVIGQPVGALLDGVETVPSDRTRTAEIRTPGGVRQFEISASAIDGTDGDHSGRTLLLRDVTERRAREQQLEVLNRVLRHNLRNDLDTVLAYAEEVEDPAVRETIRGRARELVDTAKKARDVEQLLAAYHEPRSEVDVAAVVRSAADDLRETRDCELTVEAPDSLPVRSHERLLERLVTELLENAVEHSDREMPRAAVTVEPTESGAVEIEVADDGPGIPEAEFERLFEGSETQLDHGTGVGLWVVRWAVDYLGGEIDFDSGTTGGSVVTVRLYGDRL